MRESTVSRVPTVARLPIHLRATGYGMLSKPNASPGRHRAPAGPVACPFCWPLKDQQPLRALSPDVPRRAVCLDPVLLPHNAAYPIYPISPKIINKHIIPLGHCGQARGHRGAPQKAPAPEIILKTFLVVKTFVRHSVENSSRKEEATAEPGPPGHRSQAWAHG